MTALKPPSDGSDDRSHTTMRFRTENRRDGGSERRNARIRATNTPQNLDNLRDTLVSLVGDDSALIRSAVRFALNELDLATDDDAAEHLAQATRILDAVIHPDGEQTNRSG